MNDVKVIIKEGCELSAQEKLIRYMQDGFGWREGQDFEVQRLPLMSDAMDELHNCIDCGNPFTFTIGEQEFYSKNGLKPPKRCKLCRDKRKSEKPLKSYR